MLTALEEGRLHDAEQLPRGRLWQCKTKVLDGSFDQGMVLDMALSRADRRGLWPDVHGQAADQHLDIEFARTVEALQKLFPPRENVPFVATDRIRRTPSMLEGAVAAAW
ncbi:MAG: hypothetical protein IPM08_15865 [Actinomycetales bacterium]|nr:hypothetical protein [Actinomycetales bacterium]